MFGKKKPAADGQAMRKLLHDLRASQHAIRLNAEAAQTLAKKIDSSPAERLQRHLQLLQTDLDKFREQLETLAGQQKLLLKNTGANINRNCPPPGKD